MRLTYRDRIVLAWRVLVGIEQRTGVAVKMWADRDTEYVTLARTIRHSDAA